LIVALLAKTVMVQEVAEEMGYQPHPTGTVSPADELAEVAGRECYQSWHRPNPGTSTNTGYLANIINHAHYSIFEHASFTFSVREVSRDLTHQLVRHRHLSPSQSSQRYVDESHGEVVLPPDLVRLRDHPGADDSLVYTLLGDLHHDAVEKYRTIYETLRDLGIPHKRARQAARYVLPGGHETRLVISGNVRAWREFLVKRLGVDELSKQPFADLEIYGLAEHILTILYQEVPNSVQDLWETYQKNRVVLGHPATS